MFTTPFETAGGWEGMGKGGRGVRVKMGVSEFLLSWTELPRGAREQTRPPGSPQTAPLQWNGESIPPSISALQSVSARELAGAANFMASRRPRVVPERAHCRLGLCGRSPARPKAFSPKPLPFREFPPLA